MSFQDLKTIIKDNSFKDDNEKKLEYYCNKYPTFVKDHPMTLIYCCSRSDEVNDCIKMMVILSKFYNHTIPHSTTDEIMEFVEAVMSSKLDNIYTIYLSEEKYLKSILSSPLIFFKVCNERSNFDKNQLKMMLDYRNKVKNQEISQHDASVGVGTILVDKYIKQ